MEPLILVNMGVGVMGCMDWSGLRLTDHGPKFWCQSWHCSVQFPGDAVSGAVLLS